ncbi:MAG: type II toxin-antitoxin system RelE/ParE family toxin [Gemmatimonadaceae bacterium]|nr:type II toxin-antitoxin system RelE/ParE family toxin [Gemmatimonadaceae bacterium]
MLRLRQAQQFPESGRRVPESGHADVRELFETPYRLVYRVRLEAVEVLAIVHGRQALPSWTPS